MVRTPAEFGLTQEEYDAIAPKDQGPLAYRIITALTIIGTLFVLLRVWIRLVYRSGIGLGVDDALLGVAVLFNWAAYALYVTAIKYGGIGKHMVVVIIEYPHYFRNVLLYMFAIDFVYVTLIALIKISILVMYLRVFKSVFMRRGTLILGVITGLWWLGVVLVATFQCIPVRASFDIEAAKNAKCIAKHAYFLTNGIPNIITDALILCLPILEIRKLQIKMSQRLAIAAAFLLGILVVIASICRLVSVVDLFEGPDLTHRASNFLIWNSVECNVAIMSATLPQMRPVLHWLLQVVGYTKTETTLPSTSNRGSAAPFQPLEEEGKVDTQPALRVQERSTRVPGSNDQSEKRQSYWARLTGHGNEGSDSDLPLHAIKVTHEVAWKVENKEGRELSSSSIMNESDRQPLRHYESDNEMRGYTPPGSGPTSNGYDYDIRKMENNFI